jgi:hypothetical protein
LNWGATGLNHNAILTMNPDGKSFGGIFNSGGGGGEQGMATVGTFIRLEFNKK